MKNISVIREKATIYGETTLSDEELLSLIVGEKVAGYLKNHFNDIRRISGASPTELQKIDGIGHKKALMLKASLELAKRIRQITLRPGECLTSSHQIFLHFQEKLYGLGKEHFYCVLLNSKHRIIREVLVSIGSLNFSIVHPREVFSPAIRECAESLILVHNHPSGDSSPSREDFLVTKRLSDVGKMVGIEVLDHIIIANNHYLSFQEQKFL